MRDVSKACERSSDETLGVQAGVSHRLIGLLPYIQASALVAIHQHGQGLDWD